MTSSDRDQELFDDGDEPDRAERVERIDVENIVDGKIRVRLHGGPELAAPTRDFEDVDHRPTDAFDELDVVLTPTQAQALLERLITSLHGAREHLFESLGLAEGGKLYVVSSARGLDDPAAREHEPIGITTDPHAAYSLRERARDRLLDESTLLYKPLIDDAVSVDSVPIVRTHTNDSDDQDQDQDHDQEGSE